MSPLPWSESCLGSISLFHPAPWALLCSPRLPTWGLLYHKHLFEATYPETCYIRNIQGQPNGKRSIYTYVPFFSLGWFRPLATEAEPPAVLLLIPLLWCDTACCLPEAEPVLQDFLELSAKCEFGEFLLKGCSDNFTRNLEWLGMGFPLYKAQTIIKHLSLDQNPLSCPPSFPFFQLQVASQARTQTWEPQAGPNIHIYSRSVSVSLTHYQRSILLRYMETNTKTHTEQCAIVRDLGTIMENSFPQ